jgi:hypothetical protein
MAKSKRKNKEPEIEEGSWTTLLASKNTIQKIPLDWMEKRYWVECRHISFEEGNQITEQLALELGSDPNPIVYQRKKQQMKMERIIVTFGGTKMQDDQGNPIDQRWMEMPEPVGEELRVILFRSTGELATQLFGKDAAETVKVLKEVIDQMVDENGNLKGDGLVTKEEKTIEKS